MCDLTVDEAIPAHPIDPPTLAMTISVNDSPLCGPRRRQGAGRVIRDRLIREAEGNVAILKVTETGDGDAFEVAGRGELQLGVLIEYMRREGFELSISAARACCSRPSQRREDGADRGSHGRCRRRLYRHRHREDFACAKAK